MFLKEKLKNHSLLQKLEKRENIVVECNHVRSHETSDKMHCSMLSDRKEVHQNATHEEPYCTHQLLSMRSSI